MPDSLERNYVLVYLERDKEVKRIFGIIDISGGTERTKAMAVLEQEIIRQEREATIEDLYHIPDKGKAEIVDGRIVYLPMTGEDPGNAALNVALSLKSFAKRTGRGRAFGDNVGFVVDLPRRKSFSPYAAFYEGPRNGMRFVDGAPLFAVEVRSENDYGSGAEREMAAKRADYFAAGTKVVWDVDLVGPDTVCKYVEGAMDTPIVFRRGEIADAEPALAGWTMPIDELFE